MKRLHLPSGQPRRPRPLWFGLLAASVLFMFPLLFAPWLSGVSGAGNTGGWRPFGLRGESVLAMTSAQVDGQTLFYAQTPSGLWRKVARSGADGEDWRRIDAGLPRSTLGAPLLAAWSSVPGRPLQVYALAGAKDARQLFASSDGGSTWQLVNVAPGDSPAPALAVLPGAGGRPDAIMIGTPSRLWRSVDGGATWQAAGAWPQHASGADRTGGQNDVVRRLLVEADAPDRIVAVSQTGGLWLSENAGLSWHVVGLEEFQVTAADYSSTGLWAASSGPAATGLMHSADNAAPWEARPLPVQTPGLLSGSAGVVALQIEPGIADSLYVAMRGGRVYRTIDGGRTWEQLGTPGATHVTALAVEPGTRATLYAATDDGIWARAVVPMAPTLTPTEAPGSPVPVEPSPTAPPATATQTSTHTPSPTATPTATSTATASPTATWTATETATATATPTFTPTRPRPTATRKSTATPKPATATVPPAPAAPTAPPYVPPSTQPTANPAPTGTPTTEPVEPGLTPTLR